MSYNRQDEKTLLLMEKQLFNLKFTSRKMKIEYSKLDRSSNLEKAKIRNAIQKNDEEEVKIYAESLIRKKNEAKTYLRISHKIDSIASKVESAIRMKSITSSMKSVVGCLNTVMNSTDVTQMERVMDKFSDQMEDIDVKLGHFEQAVNKVTEANTPADQVKQIIEQIACEYSLELSDKMKSTYSLSKPVSDKEVEDDKIKEDLLQQLQRINCI